MKTPHLCCVLAAWSVSKFVRAAEIMRYTGTPWAAQDIAVFTRMLYDVILPHLFDGGPQYNGRVHARFYDTFIQNNCVFTSLSTSAGNWELSIIEGEPTCLTRVFLSPTSPPHTRFAGMVMISVFTEDAALWRRALSMFEERLAAYVYHHSDGAAPVRAPRKGTTVWFGQVHFDERVDGMCAFSSVSS